MHCLKHTLSHATILKFILDYQTAIKKGFFEAANRQAQPILPPLQHWLRPILMAFTTSAKADINDHFIMGAPYMRPALPPIKRRTIFTSKAYPGQEPRPSNV